jgi:polyribonucleotide nucleotidyltransferase
MNNTTSVSAEVGGKTITIEAGLLAQQAAGAVTISTGETVLFSAATSSSSPRDGIDYFPLQIEYREKFYAAGRFPGGYMKREARPSEKEILTARITDRPLRPLFPDGFRNDVQINNMLLSYDDENDSDILSINAASAALTISEMPFCGPVGAVRVGRVDGEFVINPTHEQREKSDLNLIYAAVRESPQMIEGGGAEVLEADVVAAMKLAHVETTKLIDAQLELRKKLGLPDKVVETPAVDSTVLDAARKIAESDLTDVMVIADKMERQAKTDEVSADLKAKLLEELPEMTKEEFRSAFDKLEIEVVRKNALEKGKRIDGRGFDDLRALSGQVGLLPRTHGSAVFNRGETQALASITLGTKSDLQRMDGIAGGPTEKTFMLHYNFPPYCVGEAGRLGFTSRREIGHGALAERSLRRVFPVDYPYTVRLVSDIMGSNGSSSMASVCAGSLALMDAGVPLTKPVAGIAIGMFSDENQKLLTTDMIGAEDHCGDMDFKVAGTRDGITGFQVDLKLDGLEWDIVEGAFARAREARLKILDAMASILEGPREDLSPHAPRIEQIKIDPEKIGELIGPGGKNIRRITGTTGAEIDIEEDGTVSIFAKTADAMKMAVDEVNLISAEVEEGEIYEGPVTGITAFGAFVQVLPGKDGLVHISELADCRVNKVEDVCKMGDIMRVKCLGVDDRGRVKLSRREAMKEKDAG